MIFYSTIQPMPIKKLKTIKSTAKKSLTLLPIHSFPGTVTYDTVNTKCRIGRVYATKVFMFSAPTDEIHLFRKKNLGLYSETGFHMGMYRNFVCLWRRHNCRSQVIDISLSALIS
jgi:hypothetical protein